MIKVLYKIFLAIMIALFIGFGISVFYPAPEAPEFSASYEIQKTEQMSAEQIAQQKKFDQDQKNFQEASAKYNRNISAIAIGISVLLLILSLLVLPEIEIMSDGTLFGGLLTLVYGMIRGMMSNDSKFQFIVVSIGLVIVLVLGYVKFIRKKS